MNHIYADHAATTPVHPEVADVLVQTLTSSYGNPSSIHGTGREARKILDDARTSIARQIGVHFNEIIFTSGGTEADNLAIFGTAESMKSKGNHIITTAVEHHAVLHPCQELEKKGYDVTYLPVDQNGKISVDDVKKALREDTILVTIMFGNNEVGTIQPIEEIGALLKDHQAVFHTDAVQAFGLLLFDPKELGIDLFSVSAHKINGPKGIGFLYAREGISLSPGLFGGEQERKKRAGTENTAAIAALAKAVEMAFQNRDEKIAELNAIRHAMIEELNSLNVRYEQNGSLEDSLPHVLNLSIHGADVESLLVNLDLEGVAVSSGSACTAGSIEPSHVLSAMFGEGNEKLFNSIRFSFGYGNTVEDGKKIAQTLKKIMDRFTK
ncbi:cysteine desulfurase family protein [Jeotgalibacillus aurantiacus]|uniref:cysteine desulfurase family protein n=1 Tax=Jeotgalibacillus aurantiacus TaxID=2763266 RepID=UPI001D0B3CB1|nr:cysteine desulfurase family protein [Jeotgalibacillus aurantiacus]